MSFKKILFLVSILLSNTLYQQEIQPRLDLSAQQAWEYFGNKSTIKPQIIKVQGSQYYNEEFELSDLKYFGRKMESNNSPSQPMNQQNAEPSTEEIDDDLPF